MGRSVPAVGEFSMAKLAANLVRACLRIRPDDNVTIFFYPHTTALAEDIAEECFRIGADVNLSAYTDRFYESYMRILSADSLRKPSVFCRALSEVSTAEFWLGGGYDPAGVRRVPPGETALEFSIRGRRPFVFDGVVDDEDIAAGALDAQIPAGNVAIAPLEDSANGVVAFDLPQAWAGRS